MRNADGKYMFGAVKVGERGQVVIPKEAREVFNIKAGDLMLMLGDPATGIAMVKLDVFQDMADNIFAGLKKGEEKKNESD